MCSIKTGESLLGGANHCLEMGWASVSGWRAMVLCITCFAWIFFSLFLLSYFSILLLITLALKIILTIKLFLPHGFLYFFDSPPHHGVGGRGRGVSDWLLGGQLGLNHDIPEQGALLLSLAHVLDYSLSVTISWFCWTYFLYFSKF